MNEHQELIVEALNFYKAKHIDFYNKTSAKNCTRITKIDAAIEWVKAQEWIDLSKQEPELHQYVMCIGLNADDEPMHILANWNGHKFGFLKAGGKKCRKVNYWMPLPQLPE